MVVGVTFNARKPLSPPRAGDVTVAAEDDGIVDVSSGSQLSEPSNRMASADELRCSESSWTASHPVEVDARNVEEMITMFSV